MTGPPFGRGNGPSRIETVAVDRRRPVVGQSKPSAATLTTLYTAPPGYRVRGRVFIANQSATATTFRLSLAPLGAVDAVSQYLAYDSPIAGNEDLCTEELDLSATDVLRCYATLATVSFTLAGVKDAL